MYNWIIQKQFLMCSKVCCNNFLFSAGKLFLFFCRLFVVYWSSLCHSLVQHNIKQHKRKNKHIYMNSRNITGANYVTEKNYGI